MAELSIKNRIKRIQKHLDITADGLIGPTTLTAIENQIFDEQEPVDIQSFSLKVSRKGLQQLVKHEISSKAYYKRFLSNPVWPGGHSGITIGVGYDLGYNSQNQIRADWEGKLSNIDIEKLTVIAGLKSDNAKQALNGVKEIVIPLESAQEVFYKSTLVRFAKLTLKTYPGADLLFADAQAGILSLIYNRGSSFKGEKRKEMKAIKDLVANQDYNGISDQIILMKHLWENKGLDGLLKRRDDEARLVRLSNRDYDPEEMVRV